MGTFVNDSLKWDNRELGADEDHVVVSTDLVVCRVIEETTLKKFGCEPVVLEAGAKVFCRQTSENLGQHTLYEVYSSLGGARLGDMFLWELEVL